MWVFTGILICGIWNLAEAGNLIKFEKCTQDFRDYKPPERHIEINFGDNARLWAPPGIKHQIPFNVSLSSLLDGCNVYFSHREEFGGSALENRKLHEAQLVKRLDPKLVRAAVSGEIYEAVLVLDIPTYVSLTFQTKLTLMVQCQCVNLTEPKNLLYREKSFYFTVNDVPFKNIDIFKPVCERSILCDDNELKCAKPLKKPLRDDCHDNFWHTEIYTSDNLTGIQEISISSPGAELVETPELVSRAIGSSRTFRVIIRVECCYKGVELSVVDLAANKAKCVAGINPNLSHSNKANYLLFLVTVLLLINSFHF